LKELILCIKLWPDGEIKDLVYGDEAFDATTREEVLAGEREASMRVKLFLSLEALLELSALGFDSEEDLAEFIFYAQDEHTRFLKRCYPRDTTDVLLKEWPKIFLLLSIIDFEGQGPLEMKAVLDRGLEEVKSKKSADS